MQYKKTYLFLRQINACHFANFCIYCQFRHDTGPSDAPASARFLTFAPNHKHLTLTAEVCYIEENNAVKRVNDDKHPLYLPRQYLPQSNWRVRDEGSGKEGRTGGPVPHRVCRHQHRGDQKPGLSPGPAGSWPSM